MAREDDNSSTDSFSSSRTRTPDSITMDDDLDIEEDDMCSEYKHVLLQAGNPLVRCGLCNAMLE